MSTPGEEPMGFLSRAHKTQVLKTTAQDAPLSYLNENHQKVRPNFAPFSTTTKRDLQGHLSEGPPPGTYELRTDMHSKSTPALAGFKSKTTRFTTEKSQFFPGPGEYTLKSYVNPGYQKKHPSPTREPDSLSNLTANLRSAPSIPNKFQAYGYENRDGKLVPQKPLKAGFSGTGNDLVGPGDYDPPLYKMKKPPTAIFSKLTGRNESPVPGSVQRSGGGPGPGYYNIQEASSSPAGEPYYDDGNYMLKLNESKKRMLSSFQSKTEREAPVPKDKLDPNLPGPGTYNIPPAVFRFDSKGPTTQCFSSSDLRFRDTVPRSQRMQTSPGTYNPITSDFDKNKTKILKQKRAAARSGWAQHISFDCTEARFMQIDKKVAPPPGTYTPKVTLADSVKKENPRGGAFGSKSLRFDFEKNNINQGNDSDIGAGGAASPLLGVGGGAASPGGIGAGVGKQRTMSPPSDFKAIVTSAQTNNAIFASKTKRFLLNKSNISESPPPGTYNTAPSWYDAKGVVPIAPPVTKSILIPVAPGPGPGYYEVAAETSSDLMKRRNRKNVFLSTSERFQEEHDLKKYVYDVGKKGTGPGPGDYDPKTGAMVRSSFNVLMNPDMFE